MKFFVPAGVCVLAILALSISPSVQMPKMFFSPDKLGHLAAYGLLCWLVVFGLYKNNRLTLMSSFWAIAGCSVYGILLELVQWKFFPHRYFETGDMFANLVGAISGRIAFNFFINKI